MGGKEILSWIPNFKKDVICFSWRYVGEKSVTEALTAADRHGHTGNVCSLRLRRPVDRTPGIPENKTADVRPGRNNCLPKNDDGSQPSTLQLSIDDAAVCSQSYLRLLY